MNDSEKLPAPYRYFDVNTLFSWPYPAIVRLLYPMSIRPEAIVFISLCFGIVGAMFYAQGMYVWYLAGAICMYLKNLFDTVDGHLARARGQVTRIGRFIDSLSDFIVFASIFTGISVALAKNGHPMWVQALVVPSAISLFLQCSYFNYYLVTYVRRVNSKFPARTNEYVENPQRGVLRLLMAIYSITYGWQDRIIAALDRWGRRFANRKEIPETFDLQKVGWYNHKAFLTAESVLCFGTQIAYLIGCSAAGRIDLFVIGMATFWNLYFAGLVALRLEFFRRNG